MKPLRLAVALALLMANGVSAADAPAKPPVTPAPPPAAATLDELRTIEARVQRLAAKASASVVAIRSGTAQGSGVIVTADGFIATAGHVITKPGAEVTVLTADGKSHKATALGYDRGVDSGLVKLEAAGPWPACEMAKTPPKPGDWCVSMGHPLGYHEGRPPVVRVGRVLTSTDWVICSDCAIVSGDSGGPLLDLEGKVIGINSRIGALLTMNYHVPIEHFRRSWDRLAAKEAINADLPGKESAQVRAPLRGVVSRAGRCTARVRCDGRDAALGTVVGPQGWVLTKASELHGRITCRLSDQRELDARIVGISAAHDLAMLKIEANGLPDIAWRTEKPGVGQWLVSVGVQEDPAAIGVLSVPERKIPPPSGVLGVVVSDGDGGARIAQVLPNSPAEKAGLKPGDVVVAVEGRKVANRGDLLNALKGAKIGQKVGLSIQRGKERVPAIAQLVPAAELPGSRRRDLQYLSGGGISRRHDDFPLVLQHDSALAPADCGGPIVDLEGRVVGVNIARAGRTESYAIATATLLGLMYDLMSGRLAPAEPKPKPPAAGAVKPPPAAAAKPPAAAPAGQTKP